MDKIQIPTSARRAIAGDVELFYWDEHNELVCFSRRDGHGIATVEYMRSLPPVSDEVGNANVDAYNDSYCDEVQFVYRKRIRKPSHSYNPWKLKD